MTNLFQPALDEWLAENVAAVGMPPDSVKLVMVEAASHGQVDAEFAAAMQRALCGPAEVYEAPPLASLQCVGCGDYIASGTMNAEGCALEAEGWRCGVCVEAKRPWPATR